MRFGLVHRITTDAVGALAVLALIAAGASDVWTIAALGGALLLALLTPSRLRESRSVRRALALVVALVFVAMFVRVYCGFAFVTASFELLTLLLVARIATRRGAQDDASLVLLSLFGFVAASIAAPLTYAVSFIGIVVVTPAALTLSHLRREVEGNHRQGARDRTGMPVDVARILRSRRVVGRGFLLAILALGVPILAVVAAFFALVPRPAGGATIGLSESIDLAQRGPLRTDESTVLRFRVAGVDAAADTAPDYWPLRLRAAVLVDFDGQRWRHGGGRTEKRTASVTFSRPADPARDRKVSIDLDAMEPPLLMIPTRTVALATDGELIEQGSDGELRTRGTHAIHYDVWLASGEPEPEVLGPSERTRALALPANVSTRVRGLAHEWADKHASPSAKANAIERALRNGYRYDLDSAARGAPAPIDDFLFESKSGHCELFASAMAAMLREVAIPARVVTGLLGGRRNRFGGFYAVRQRDAHAWVEAYVDGAWRTYDPTPTASPAPLERGALATTREVVDTLGFGFRQHVVSYDNTSAKKHVREVLAALVVLLIVVGIARQGRQRGLTARSSNEQKPAGDLGDAALLYRRLEDVLAQQGIVRPTSTTPSQLATSLEVSKHPAAAEVKRLTEIYLAARFGHAQLSAADRAAFVRCTEALSPP